MEDQQKTLTITVTVVVPTAAAILAALGRYLYMRYKVMGKMVQVELKSKYSPV